GVRVGFHSGPVIQREDDVFGDTVNMAARLVEQAGKGQIIISHETAELFSPAFRMFTRPLYSIQVKGKAEEVLLCEVMWRPAEGDSEMLLQREELTLRKHGWIAFGQPRSGTTELVEYFCD